MPMELLQRLCCTRLPLNIGDQTDIEKRELLRTALMKKSPSRSWGLGWAMNSACHGTLELCTAVGLNGSASLPANSPRWVNVGHAPAWVQKPLLGSG